MTVELQPTGPVTSCFTRVTSVEEYLNAVDKAFAKICPMTGRCELWYRGQNELNQPTKPVRWDLIPSIARSPRNPLMEIIYLSKFKSYAIPFVQELPSFPIPNGQAAYWHWLFMMQHYGVPTRIMDWSRDALTGLFFALDGRSSNDGRPDAAVWILNPVRLNEAFSFHSFVKPGYIPNVDEEIVDLYFGPNAKILESKKPAAVIGPLNNPHIVAQKGVFTVFPHDREVIPLNLFADASNYLVEICVAANRVSEILTELEHYGVTRFTLYPDITQVKDQINLEVQEEGQLPSATASSIVNVSKTSVNLSI
ncbi:FRG domain-containing protein [Desulfosporosinus sp. FKA]|uniref:FRG domain-containing protein n=1 Tax=Desulfosporosinus sp. FKA TaxID=1969834 RepID=UPI000B4A41BC|nr:FRG domain-containing protein [Desulfosporosinus sp. FKA]